MKHRTSPRKIIIFLFFIHLLMGGALRADITLRFLQDSGQATRTNWSFTGSIVLGNEISDAVSSLHLEFPTSVWYRSLEFGSASILPNVRTANDGLSTSFSGSISVTHNGNEIIVNPFAQVTFGIFDDISFNTGHIEDTNSYPGPLSAGTTIAYSGSGHFKTSQSYSHFFNANQTDELTLNGTGNKLIVTTVPEPSTHALILIIFGIICLLPALKSARR